MVNCAERKRKRMQENEFSFLHGDVYCEQRKAQNHAATDKFVFNILKCLSSS